MNHLEPDVAAAFTQALSRSRSKPQYLRSNVISLLGERRARKHHYFQMLAFLTIGGLATYVWVAKRKQDNQQ